ncbi:VOC family protein [Pseudoalteromonas sp. NZS71_1]|uniref:SMU1112c/YaeR family gloxylase I-like metalloprotein n=1 Tax=Pseudoalteromonas sp. NZS71_1 TaxID=2792072 RepID=UPI0018CC9ACC|nr:VOC family protein [Pseudoalteromonas sp. NZS71_1]MBH0033440.1 VOC family protein [Pseudoalteromonas sp. NZS71_1]
MKLLGIHHAAIISSDYARSKHFYSNVLKLNVINEHFRADRNSYKLDLAMPDGSQIELFSFDETPSRPSYPEAQGLRHLAFKVADIQTAKTYLESCGVNVEDIRVDEITGKKFTFFADPDNLPLELYEV